MPTTITELYRVASSAMLDRLEMKQRGGADDTMATQLRTPRGIESQNTTVPSNAAPPAHCATAWSLVRSQIWQPATAASTSTRGTAPWSTRPSPATAVG